MRLRTMAMIAMALTTPASADEYEEKLLRHIEATKSACDHNEHPSERDKAAVCGAYLAYVIAFNTYVEFQSGNVIEGEEPDNLVKPQAWRPALR